MTRDSLKNFQCWSMSQVSVMMSGSHLLSNCCGANQHSQLYYKQFYNAENNKFAQHWDKAVRNSKPLLKSHLKDRDSEAKSRSKTSLILSHFLFQWWTIWILQLGKSTLEATQVFHSCIDDNADNQNSITPWISHRSTNLGLGLWLHGRP